MGDGFPAGLGALPPTALAILTTVLTTILTVAVFTRFTTGRPESKRDGGRVPFMPAYWFPYLGHSLQMTWNADGFLARMRDRSPLGAFSLNFSGRTFTFLHKPSMVAAVMAESQWTADDEHLSLSSTGLSKEERSQPWFQALHATYQQLASGPTLTQLVDRTVANLRAQIVDLVTFNSYPSDQMEWERFADADIIETPDGQRLIEVDLIPLIKNFVVKTANPPLFGTDFDKNFEEVPQLLWAYEALFPSPSAATASAAWLPGWLTAWVPQPTIQKAKRARRTLLLNLEEYHDAWEKAMTGEEPGIRWQDLDDASTLVKERNKVFHEHKVPIRARAVADLALLRGMHADAAPLTFWLLYEILRDPVLVQQIREEMAPHLQAVQPKNEFSLGVWVPPRVEHLDTEALATKCPLLRSAYVETMRLYTDAWLGRRISKSAVLGGEGGEGDGGCAVEQGDCVYVSHGLHHLDPRYFPQPKEWQGARHVKEAVDEKGKPSKTVDFGTIWPFGTNFNMCPEREFALKESILYAALIIAMYDIQPVSKNGEWPTLRTRKGAVTQHPVGQCRVQIRKRELPVEG